MKFIISAQTDVGIKRDTNQDSLSVMTASTNIGKIVFAILCDGMGGLSKGEVASASVVQAFSNWFINEFPNVLHFDEYDDYIEKAWKRIITKQNEKIANYGKKLRISLGTTATAMLILKNKVYIVHVGDTRVYEITNSIRQITTDQTMLEREIKRGNVTQVDGKQDPRRHILLQCIGSSNVVVPDIYVGQVSENAVYMLCSDGFRHEISTAEIYDNLNPKKLMNENVMKEQIDYLIQENINREEQDNISCILVRTIEGEEQID